MHVRLGVTVIPPERRLGARQPPGKASGPKQLTLTRAGQAINTSTTAQRQMPELGRASSPLVDYAAKGC